MLYSRPLQVNNVWYSHCEQAKGQTTADPESDKISQSDQKCNGRWAQCGGEDWQGACQIVKQHQESNKERLKVKLYLRSTREGDPKGWSTVLITAG
jgi:hypothetical protein